MAIAIHLDTDIGGDSDDLCALALLLGAPECEIVGITTSADHRGGRAAFVYHALTLAGRTNIPVASGASGFLRGQPGPPPTLQDSRYWPDLNAVPADAPGPAIDLLLANAEAGATIVAIGPFTNLAVLETLRPGTLANTNVVVMGGYTGPHVGLPQWAASHDYNVQADIPAARIVFEQADPLVAPLNVTAQTWLRGAELAPLREGGGIAQLIARQGELQRLDWDMPALAAANPGLPDDLLNFQHDPFACAAALGWDCVGVSELPLAVVERDGSLLLEREPTAPTRRVVTSVDAAAFAARWLECAMRA